MSGNEGDGHDWGDGSTRSTRRRYLLGAGTGLVTALSGCSAIPGGNPTGTDAAGGSPTPTETGTATATETPDPTETPESTPTATPRPERTVDRRLDLNQLETRLREFEEQGLQPLQVSGFDVNGSQRFAVIWGPGEADTWVMRVGLSPSAYQQAFDRYRDNGLRPTRVSAYDVDGDRRFGSIWTPFDEDEEWRLYYGRDAGEYSTRYARNRRMGLKLQDIAWGGTGGTAYYSSAWQPDSGTDWFGVAQLSGGQFRSTFNAQIEAGRRPVAVESYVVGGARRYAAVFEGGSTDVLLRFNVAPPDVPGFISTARNQSLRVTDISGSAVGGELRYAILAERLE